MADMPSDFWSGWIITLTVASLAGLVWLIFSVYFGKDPDSDHTSPVWDETLSEGANPAPMWWFWMILAALVFSAIYLMLYPGLGSHAGIMAWSQGGALEKSMNRFDAAFAERRQGVVSAELADLHDDVDAMGTARGIFTRNCAACHGPQGLGQANAFPNLRDTAWQWGGTPEAISQSITAGRRGAMVGWLPVLGEDGVEQLVTYVKTLSAGTSDPNAPAATQFTTYCSACHAADGTGVAMLGGPDLTDDVWLYGGSDDALRTSIAEGRNGIMPAFGDRLDDVQLKLLVAWLTRPPKASAHTEAAAR